MPKRKKLILIFPVLIFSLFILSWFLGNGIQPVNASSATTVNFTPGITPTTVATFNCISVYWKPGGGSNSNTCKCEYRVAGSSTWNRAQDLWYDTTTYSDHNMVNSYRGSIVGLTPNTQYEIRLTLGSGTTSTITETTWNENFPVGSTIYVGSGSATYTTTSSGSASGYIVYDGGGSVINVNKNSDNCIVINKNYVILRNFDLRGARKAAIIFSSGAHHVIIENCDISAWGSLRTGTYGNSQGAIEMTTNNTNVVIQRNKIHNPSYDTNNWGGGSHPYGPCGMKLGSTNTDSNGRIKDNGCWTTVVRYNEIYSGSTSLHFEDGVQCAPPDSDIYGNIIKDINDNGLELETGGDRNVRAWGNYLYHIYNAISCVPVHIGPLYVFRNVSDGYDNTGNSDGARPYKVGGNSYSGSWYETQSTKGYAYFYHNVNLSVSGTDDGFQQTDGGPKYIVSRNNILLATHKSIQGCTDSTNNFDYDLYNTTIDVTESHGISGLPTWEAGSGPDGGTAAGWYQLSSSSPGYGDACLLYNFNDMYTSPDRGAHQHGTAKMEFGVNAYLNSVPTPSSTPTPSGTTFFADDFENGNASQWSTSGGTWSVVTDGTMVYQNSNDTGDAWSYAGSSLWTDYSVEAKVKLVSVNGSDRFAAIYTRWADGNNHYYIALRSSNTLQLKKKVGGTVTTLSQMSYAVSTETWYTLKLVVNGSNLSAYVNGTLQLTATDSSLTSGKVAVGMYKATAEFDDLQVMAISSTPTPTPIPEPTPTPTSTPTSTPATLFSDNFESGTASQWQTMGGTWSVGTDGTHVYKQSSTSGSYKAYAGLSSWANYSLETRVKPVSFGSGDYIGIIARWQDSSNYYYLNLGGSNILQLQKKVSGTTTTLNSISFTVTSGTWYTLKLVVNGNSLSAYVNGNLQLTATDASFSSGNIGVSTYYTAGEFDDVAVTGL